MSESDNQLILHGLTTLQVAELKATVSPIHGAAVTERESPPLPGGAHGEPILISVAISVTPAVVAAVAMWLAKQKSRRTERLRFYRKTPGGAEAAIEFDRSMYGEGESAAPAIEAFFKGVFNAGSK
jgi:hypothetical protein